MHVSVACRRVGRRRFCRSHMPAQASRGSVEAFRAEPRAVGNTERHMPKQYSLGGRGAPERPGGRPRGHNEPSPRQTLRERLAALRNVKPFLASVWQTSPALSIASIVLRLGRSLLPVATLYVGKLIIDEVTHLLRA